MSSSFEGHIRQLLSDEQAESLVADDEALQKTHLNQSKKSGKDQKDFSILILLSAVMYRFSVLRFSGLSGFSALKAGTGA